MALKYINNSLVIILSILFISSCTIHNRVNKYGYSVKFKHTASSKNKNLETTNIKLNEADLLVEELDNQSLNTKEVEVKISADESNIKSGGLNIDNSENENLELNIEGSEIISPLDKQMSLREIYKLPRSSIKNEIKKEFKKFKALTPRRRLSIVLKLAIIFTALSLVLLIVSFWLWYFEFISELYPNNDGGGDNYYAQILLISGLATLGLGLFLFILSSFF